MRELSRAARRVQPSPIRQMFNLAADMEDVVSFTVGEPDFYTPENIVDAAVNALKDGKHHYTPNAGILPLRKAIASVTAKSHGLDYDPETQVIVTAGGMEALMLTMLTILDPGDEFILSDPCWTNYSRQIEICSADPVFIPVFAENQFMPQPDVLEQAITDKTKGFLINSPMNPTGGVGSLEALKKLAEIAVAHDLYVISDEVYSRIVYDDEQVKSIATLPGMAERTIVVNSFSKTYSMTGWRVGYAMGPASIIGNMVKLQENVAACVNTAAQYGALEALEGPQQAVSDMCSTYAARRSFIMKAFDEIDGLTCFMPKGTFYAFVDVSKTGLSATKFAKDLLSKARVIVVPGDAFGKSGDRYVRMSFAASMETIQEGMRRIKHYMETTYQGKCG